MKRFCSILELFSGNLRSVAVFLRSLEVSWDVFAKRFHIFCGVRSWRGVKNTILDSVHTNAFLDKTDVYSSLFSSAFTLFHLKNVAK